MQPKTKVIEIVRPIRMYGKHAEAGELHEVPVHVAHDLIGSRVAKLADGEEDDNSTVRVDEATQRDPAASHRDPTTLRRAAPAKPPAKPAQTPKP
jgi:hypothetical protein